MNTPGANEPCPCGSQAKYKRCCEAASDVLDMHIGAREFRAAPPQVRLALRVIGWAARTHGSAYDPLRLFPDDEEAFDGGPLVLLAYAAFHVRVERVGRVVEAFLAAEGAALPPADRAILQAEAAAGFGVWRLVAAPDGTACAHDVLTGRELSWPAKGAPTALFEETHKLLRLLEVDGRLVASAEHFVEHSDDELEALLQSAREALGERGVELPEPPLAPSVLERPEVVAALLAAWEDPEFVFEQEPETAAAPSHWHIWELRPGTLERVVAALRTLPDARETGSRQELGGVMFTFEPPGAEGDTPTDEPAAGCFVRREHLLARGPTPGRADGLRRDIERAAGAWLTRHRYEVG